MKNTKNTNEDKWKNRIALFLRALVILIAVRQFFIGNYSNVFLCVLTLILFMIPSIIEKHLYIELPNTLEVIILLFIFSAEILGELNKYYLTVDGWDTMLHTTNGFLMAAIGFALVDILNRSDKISFSLSPLFVGLMAFCFSMTTGVLWEFFEWGADMFLKTDMQKDTWLQVVTSVEFNPDGLNKAISIPFDQLVTSGELTKYGAYLDIGLHDTMKDMFVNFIGAVVFSIIGVIYVKNRGEGKFAKRFIPKLKEEKVNNDKYKVD